MTRIQKFYVFTLTVTTFAAGISVGLYIAAAFIGPSILESAK
jgi:phage shock protein PspC (stress-responsive transcriptional regulator)